MQKNSEKETNDRDQTIAYTQVGRHAEAQRETVTQIDIPSLTQIYRQTDSGRNRQVDFGWVLIRKGTLTIGEPAVATSSRERNVNPPIERLLV